MQLGATQYNISNNYPACKTTKLDTSNKQKQTIIPYSESYEMFNLSIPNQLSFPDRF
jgi:hypothetical protein